MLKLHSSVIYVDPVGVAHAGIVTAIWTGNAAAVENGMATAVDDHTKGSINVVFASKDASKTDIYGRQIERSTSLCHMTAQPAHGNYWRLVDEAAKETEQTHLL